MYLKFSEQLYEWICKEDGGHKVGRRVELQNGEPLTKLIDKEVCFQMRHANDGKLQLVKFDELYPYDPNKKTQP